jgi:hypothetical protein
MKEDEKLCQGTLENHMDLILRIKRRTLSNLKRGDFYKELMSG